MDAEVIGWLRSEEGRTATVSARARLAEGASELSVGAALRSRLTVDQSRGVMALLEGRRVAAGKFEDAERLFLDRAAAEQASPAEVARYTASRLAAAVGRGRVADLGCGAGADTLALAERLEVIAVDLDPARLAMLEANAAARDVTSRVSVACADLVEWVPPAEVRAAWLDPSRRDSSGRRLDPRRWTPPLDVAIEVARRFAVAGIKLAPGIDVAALPAEAEVEFVSLEGRLVEAVLWLGAGFEAGVVRATALPSEATLARRRHEADVAADVRPPGAYLYDLDPGVGRAGLVRRLARDLEAWQLSEEVSYLSADVPRSTPFARRFAVLGVRPFSERGARDLLAAAGTGRIEVMRRGAPVDTNALERLLNARLPGGDPVHTLALTRVGGRLTMLLCARER
ncbi:MAG: methyltransferase domain-containing protein [Dehalococcoidia bacterium]|nr:methyltransferase domain-containing protein [Dehalococcoidia bacterium]